MYAPVSLDLRARAFADFHLGSPLFLSSYTPVTLDVRVRPQRTL